MSSNVLTDIVKYTRTDEINNELYMTVKYHN